MPIFRLLVLGFATSHQTAPHISTAYPGAGDWNTPRYSALRRKTTILIIAVETGGAVDGKVRRLFRRNLTSSPMERAIANWSTDGGSGSEWNQLIRSNGSYSGGAGHIYSLLNPANH